MRHFYSALYYLLLPLVLLRMVWRSRRAPAYRRRLAERFGLFRAPPGGPAIWVHAVSVGEVIAVAPIVESLMAAYPDHRIVLTTTTPTGSERVRELFGERVFHVYVPWDLPGPVRRFLRRTRPRLLVLVETELWPNMLHYSRAAGCRILLANARLSENSARGYRRFARLTRKMLGSLDTVACQTQADGERFLALGLPAEALRHIGSIKFDVSLDGAQVEAADRLRDDFATGQRPVLVAASTHAGEEALILKAFKRIRQAGVPGAERCLLVLVPRHPERFNEVYTQCLRTGWTVVRRSGGQDTDPADILLVDTMGELLLLLGTATVAVIGGSLVERGGHNVLEAAVWGVPTVTGPHVYNFTETTELLAGAGALLRLERASELAPCLLSLLGDPQRRERMGAAGRQVLADNRGASQRLLALVAELLV
jgi:3-deoxy-D-manno-octulosonic-acid transferase